MLVLNRLNNNRDHLISSLLCFVATSSTHLPKTQQESLNHHILLRVVQSITDNGSEIRETVMVLKNGQMEHDMMVIIP